MLNTDYHFENHGSIWLVRQRTTQAAAHLHERCGEDDAQWFGDALAVEPRYVEELAINLKDDGFTVGG